MSEWDQFARAGAADEWDQFEAVAAPTKRKVGAGEAFVRGIAQVGSQLGQAATALPGAIAMPFDYLGSKLGLTEPGALTDAVSGPFNRMVESERRNRIDPAAEEAGLGAQVAHGLGQFVGMVPEIMTGRPAVRAAQEVGSVASAMTNAMRNAAPTAAQRVMSATAPEAIGAIPAAAVHVPQTYRDLTAAGADPLTAGIDAALSIPMTMAQFAVPVSAAGGILRRAATGAGTNMALGGGQRAIDAAILPGIATPVDDPAAMTQEAALGALMALLLGRRAPASLEEQGLVARMALDLQRAGEAADAAAAQQRQADLARYAPILEANGVALDDPRADRIVSILKEREAKQAQAAAKKPFDAPSPDEQRVRLAERPGGTIFVDSQGRADAPPSTSESLPYPWRNADERPAVPPGEIDATKAGMLSAEGTAAKTEVQARQAFDVAEAQAKRKQDALDAGTMAGEPRDLRDASAGGTTGPEPLSPRMQQDAAAQSYAPPRGVGTGENQPDPRRAAQRITTRPGAEYLPAEEPPNQTPARAPQTYDSTAERQGGELAPPRPPEEPPALAGPQARPALPAPPAAEQPIKTPEPPRLAAPPKPARRVTAEQLDGKPLSYEHTVGGKKTKVSHKDAGAALRQADSRVDSIRRLIDCLGA